MTTISIFFSAVFRVDAAEIARRHRTTLNRLSRILERVQSAQMMHPSMLTSEYGSMNDYLKAYLSTDDYRYFVSLQPTVTPAYALVTKTA